MRRRVLLAFTVVALTLGAGGAAPKLVAKIASPLGPCAATGAFGSVWVTAFSDAKLVRIDPKRNQVTARVAVGSQPCGIVAGAGSLWLNGYGTSSVERVDPRTRKVRRIRVGSSPFDVAFDKGTASWKLQPDGTWIAFTADEQGQPLLDMQEYLINNTKRRRRAK